MCAAPPSCPACNTGRHPRSHIGGWWLPAGDRAGFGGPCTPAAGQPLPQPCPFDRLPNLAGADRAVGEIPQYLAGLGIRYQSGQIGALFLYQSTHLLVCSQLKSFIDWVTVLLTLRPGIARPWRQLHPAHPGLYVAAMRTTLVGPAPATRTLQVRRGGPGYLYRKTALQQEGSNLLEHPQQKMLARLEWLIGSRGPIGGDEVQDLRCTLAMRLILRHADCSSGLIFTPE